MEYKTGRREGVGGDDLMRPVLFGSSRWKNPKIFRLRIFSAGGEIKMSSLCLKSD